MGSAENLNGVDIDTMLWHVGDFGKYQFILMSLFGVINTLSAFHYFAQTFISLVPEYTCELIQADNKTLTVTSTCPTMSNAETYELCQNHWKNNRDYGYFSLVQELNWICDQEWKPALGQSVFFIGSVFGSLGFGILADRIGRLHVLVMSNMLALLGNILTLFSSTITFFAISRFIAGCATDSNFVMMYIIVMEYIKPSMRTFGLNLCIGIFYCLSCVMVPWVVVFFKHWKWFLLLVALSHIIVLAFYLILIESAQWLISQGKIDQAIGCFRKIAEINKRTIDPKVYEQLRSYSEQNIKKSSHESVIGLLKTPKLRKKTCILIFKSMVMTLGYDTISRNINGFGYSPFVIFSLSSATIFPACAFILVFQDRVGRKALASGSLLITGFLTASAALILAISEIKKSLLTTCLVIVARLSINVAYNSGAQYAVELIPTVVRGQGVSMIHVIGYSASFFSPQILYLGSIWTPFPEVILGILLTVGAIACLFLPETLNRTLPITLQDGEIFGEDERIFEFSCCKRPLSDSKLQLTPHACNTKTVTNYF